MGYFSEQNLKIQEEYIDRSYFAFEEQLLWRYEELKERYLALRETDEPIFGDDSLGTDDYRYAPMECLLTTDDVWRAMEIAKKDLEEKCGIIVQTEDGEEEEVTEMQDCAQMTIFEIALSPICPPIETAA